MLESQRSCFGFPDHPKAVSILSSQNTNKANLESKAQLQDSSRLSHLKYKQAKYFQDKVLREKVDISSKLPCSLALIDSAPTDLMVVGQNKLDEEFESARKIPEAERFMIDKAFLRELEEQEVQRRNTDVSEEITKEVFNPSHEIIAEHYDKGKAYFA